MSRAAPQDLVVPLSINHNIVSKRLNFSNLRPIGLRVIGKAFPLFLHRFAAGYPQALHIAIRRDSTAFPRFLHMFYTRFSSTIQIEFRPNFPQSFRRKSEGISRLGRREKGRKRSGGGGCVEKVDGRRLGWEKRPQDVGAGAEGANRVGTWKLGF